MQTAALKTGSRVSYPIAAHLGAGNVVAFEAMPGLGGRIVRVPGCAYIRFDGGERMWIAPSFLRAEG